MKRTFYVALVTGLLSGSMVISVAQAENTGQTGQQNQRNMQRTDTRNETIRGAQMEDNAAHHQMGADADARAGMRMDSKTVTQDSAQEIRSILGSAVTSALGGDFEDFVDNLSNADRERIGSQTNNNTNAIQQAYNKLNEAWEKRYNDLDLNDSTTQDRVFNYQVESNKQTEQMGNNPKIVTLRIPASHGLPEARIKLVDEGTAKTTWRIDAPDNITGQQLQEALARELNTIASTQSQWPQDANQAAAMAAHRILMTVASRS